MLFAVFSAVHVLSQFLGILLLRVKLEVHNVTLVQGNFLIVTNVDLLGTLAKSRSIVRSKMKRQPTITQLRE